MTKSKRLCLALFLLAVTGSPVFAAQQQEHLSFRQAADLMLNGNPSYIQQKLETDIARNSVLQAKGSYLPRLDFAQGYFRSNNPVTVFGTLLNQRAFTVADFAIPSLNNPDAINDLSSKFQLGWLVYDFGGREARVGAAEIQSRVAGLKLEATRTALLQELVKRYFALSLAAQRQQTAAEALSSAQGRLDQARSRVEQGLVVQTDLLSAQVFVARRQEEKIEADNQRMLAAAALAELLGQSNGTAAVEPAALSEQQFPEHELGWWRE